MCVKLKNGHFTITKTATFWFHAHHNLTWLLIRQLEQTRNESPS